MRICPYCGQQQADHFQYCTKCGKKLPDIYRKPEPEEPRKSESEELRRVEPQEEAKPSAPLQAAPAAPQQPEPPKQNRNVLIGVLLAIVLAAGIGIGFLFARNGGDDRSSSSYTSEPADSYVVSEEMTDSSSQEISDEPSETDTEDSASSETSVVKQTEPEPDPEPEPEPAKTKYKTRYVMKVRNSPSLNGERVGRLEEGDVVEIIDYSQADDGGYWGKIGEGRWVCIYDKEMTYLVTAD